MEEGINVGDLQVNAGKLSSLRLGGGLKSTLSGKSTPRNSPTYRRLHSGRTPRREGRTSGGFLQWFRSSRLVYWLLLITLWTYLGFFVQSRWAHDNKDDFMGFGNKMRNANSDAARNERRSLINKNESSPTLRNDTARDLLGDGRKLGVAFADKGSGNPPRKDVPRKRTKRSLRRRKGRGKKKSEVNKIEMEVQEPEIPMTNTTYGMLVGPFGSMEDRLLEWSPAKRSGTCDRKGDFARLVWSRRFILIFHELSMTGAPLSMMELATELLSCGATVSAVVLSRKGGLMTELARRRIKVLEDKADLSFKTAMKADVVIAGSAVCASWIDRYMDHYPAGGSQITWWIMENRLEYFNRTKPVLNRVKMVVFLSEEQSKQWLTWCHEENIKLRYPPAIVPLSVNDELAFVAGIASSLNTPSLSTEKMTEKRQLLREAVRKEMGLTDNDMLLISLSSINPGKGQLLLLESVRWAIENDTSEDELKIKNPVKASRKKSKSARKQHSRVLMQNLNDFLSGKDMPISFDNLNTKSKTSEFLGLESEKGSRRRKALSITGESHGQDLKVLIGSVGSKSNKIPYVEEMLKFLSENSNLSRSLLWTPATTHVASLYSAADVYVINSQGMGETFGRVTIEAMAFGLPVLGTDAGGTKEIVQHNETGLLHPPGRPGIEILARNIQHLLKKPSARQQMGRKGREKVEKMYLKRHMYKKFAPVLSRCMR